MVREIRDRKLSQKLASFIKSPFFIPVLLLLIVVISIPVISLVTSKPVDIRQRAATPGVSATINVTPPTGSVSPGEQFSVDVVLDGGGQAFNAAQATVAVSSNLTLQAVTITPQASGGCNFTFANENSTPSITNPSFAGAILNDSSNHCTLYTLKLSVNGTSGTGVVSITNGQVKSSVDHSEIFLSSQNGNYTIVSTPPTPIAQSVLSLSPLTSNVTAGANFNVEVRVNTNGQTVNALQTDISYPTNLLSVVSISNTNGDFGIEAQKTDSNGAISLAYGTITPKSGDLLVVTITFLAKSSGTANVAFANASVISDVSNTDVLKSSIDGQYTIIGSALTPTPTAVPTVPLLTPTPTRIPPTPTPTIVTPTPTSPVVLTPTSVPALSLAISAQPTDTYASSFLLWGTKSSNISTVLVNNSSIGLSYPSETTWQIQMQLAMGANTYSVVGKDSSGNTSPTQSITVNLHRIGDINGDNAVDITDLSLFGTDWEKTSALNNVLSDMNKDNKVDLTDFSILASAYGN
jgi:hypothetical protein